MQTIVSLMMTSLSDGGAEAAKGILTGTALKVADNVSELWKQVFAEKPESYPLADRVARRPHDLEAQQQLRSVLEEVPSRRSQLWQGVSVQTGDIKAEKGSVAGVVFSNSTVTIHNK